MVVARFRSAILPLLAAVLLVLVAACQAPKQQSHPAPPPGPPTPPSQYCAATAPSTAAQYQAAFDGFFSTNTGWWAAGDGGTPVPLPDGRILWLYGDTILGIRQPNGAIVEGTDIFVNNGFVVQDGRCFRPVNEPIPDPAGTHWFWPSGAIVDGNRLRVFGSHMRRTGGQPPFNFQLVSMDVATFSLPDLAYLGRTALAGTGPNAPTYGESVLRVGDTVYLYGRAPGGGFVAEHRLARAPVSSVRDTSTWQYWTGGGWSPMRTLAGPLLFEGDGDPITPPDMYGPNSALRVAPNPLSITVPYLASGFPVDGLAFDEIQTWGAPELQGPFTREEQVAVVVDSTQCPTSGQQLAYGSQVHLDLPNVPVARWSINHLSLAAVLEDSDLYKVCFATPNPGSIPD